jgi:hypothetical protein
MGRDHGLASKNASELIVPRTGSILIRKKPSPAYLCHELIDLGRLNGALHAPLPFHIRDARHIQSACACRPKFVSYYHLLTFY